VLCLARVFALFPQARVLACVRDPVEVAESYRQRRAREQALGKPAQTWGLGRRWRVAGPLFPDTHADA
jgi:hypothetical protein